MPLPYRAESPLPSPILFEKTSLYDPIRSFEGGIFATCAGMVLMATEVGDPRVRPLGLMEMAVDRNAFGRQRESFEADLAIDGIDGDAFHAVFIRAPVVTSVGTGMTILASIDKGIVAVEKGKHMAFSFHPELGNDTRSARAVPEKYWHLTIYPLLNPLRFAQFPV